MRCAQPKALLLKRMLSDRPIGYVDLRSPAGIGLGALVYNYDGKVFASDEGRMLAEMGDRTFELGDLRTDDYRSLVLSDKLVGLIGNTLAQCAPQCSSCAYEPHCGAEPVLSSRDPGRRARDQAFVRVLRSSKRRTAAAVRHSRGRW